LVIGLLVIGLQNPDNHGFVKKYNLDSFPAGCNSDLSPHNLMFLAKKGCFR